MMGISFTSPEYVRAADDEYEIDASDSKAGGDPDSGDASLDSDGDASNSSSRMKKKSKIRKSKKGRRSHSRSRSRDGEISLADKFTMGLALAGNFAQTTTSVSIGTLSASSSTAGELALGGGVFFNIPFNEGPGMVLVDEVTVSFLGRKGTFQETTTSANWVKLSNLIRIYPIPFLTIGVGGYYSLGIGNYTVTAKDGTSTSVGFADVGLKKSDFGLEAGLGTRFPLSESFGILGDIRYSLGLANIISNDLSAAYEALGEVDVSTKFNELALYVGAVFSL